MKLKRKMNENIKIYLKRAFRMRDLLREKPEINAEICKERKIDAINKGNEIFLMLPKWHYGVH